MSITMYRDNFHLAKLAKQDVPSIWASFTEGHPVGTYHVYNPMTRKIIFTKDMIFLQMSYGDWNKIENPVVVPKSYEGSDNDEELETVPVINKNDNNNYNVVSDSKSKSNDEESLFDEEVDKEMETIPKTTVNAKAVQRMKNCKLHLMVMPTKTSA